VIFWSFGTDMPMGLYKNNGKVFTDPDWKRLEEIGEFMMLDLA
jgi:hypothetical protein